MSTVRGGGRTPQGGYQTDTQMDRTHREDRARDDLRKSYAGDENKGPAAHQKTDHQHSTHVGERHPGNPTKGKRD